MKQATECRLEQDLAQSDEDRPEYHWEWHCVRSLDILRKYKIQLVFLMETSHPAEKNDTVQERKEKRQEAVHDRERLLNMCIQWKDLLDSIQSTQYDVKKAKRNAWKYTRDLLSVCAGNAVRANASMYETFRRLIECAGLRWIECAEGQEAEYVAVDMARYGMVDYVMSNDSDCIACLCPVYLFDINWESETYKRVNLDSLLQSMRLTPEQFQMACCCMGNDYVDGQFREGVYWGSISNEWRRRRVRKKEDMTKQFPDVKERLEFCWDVYTRANAVPSSVIETWMRGDGCVSVRKLHAVRTTGICV